MPCVIATSYFTYFPHRHVHKYVAKKPSFWEIFLAYVLVNIELFSLPMPALLHIPIFVCNNMSTIPWCMGRIVIFLYWETLQYENSFFIGNLKLLNTYWATSSPMLKISMLPNAIVDEGEARVHYGVWEHTNFQHWTRRSPNKCFSITYKQEKENNKTMRWGKLRKLLRYSLNCYFIFCIKTIDGIFIWRRKHTIYN